MTDARDSTRRSCTLLLDSAPPSSPATFDPPPCVPLSPQRSLWCRPPLHIIAPTGLRVRRLPTAMGRKRPTSSPPPIMNTTGLDSSSLPAGLDSWDGLRTDLSSHDKATVAIDAITNELPERSTLPFFFFFFFFA